MAPAPTPVRAPANARTAQLIQLAFIAGLLLFGPVVTFVHRQPGWVTRLQPPAMAYVLFGLVIGSVVTAIVLRGRVAREPNQGRRVVLLLNGWAVGQGTGLFGGVMYLLTGQSQWYLIGLLAAAITFALLPAWRAR